MTSRRALAIIATCTALTPIIWSGSANATTQLDQQTGVDTGSAGEVLNTTITFGQVFTAGITGSLSSASVHLYTLSGTPSLTQELYAVNPGTSLPTGAALASQAITPGPGAWTWIETAFSAPINVTAGTQYALVISSSDVSALARWARGLAYAGGTGVYGTGGTWLQLTGVPGDMTFRTYVTTASPFSSPAADGPSHVLQQVGARGTEACTDVDDSALSFGSGVHGGWSESWAQWANDGAGGSVCTRTLAYEVNSSQWVTH